MKVMHLALTKVLTYENVSVDKSKLWLQLMMVLMLVALPYVLPLRYQFRKKFIIIDKILMESNHLLFHIHLRFNKKIGFV